MPIKPDYDDGTPKYNKTVRESYRRLQYRTCTYSQPPKSGEGVRLGVYQAQADCGDGAVEKNISRLEGALKDAADRGVQVLSFPELYLQGYTQSPESAMATAVTVESDPIQKCCTAAKANGVAVIMGYGEKLDRKDKKPLYYDSIVVIGDDGKVLLNYRKTQLYAEQERVDWSFGMDIPTVFKVNDFPIGVLNCYENEFPELVRVLALQGAKLIVGPTAADGYYKLAKTGERSDVPYPDVSKKLLPAFAYSNNLFYAYSNRCGYEERDGSQWHYRGNSIIIDPHGDILVEAEHERDTMLVADCIPEYYGDTHPEPEFGYLQDRRPDLYKMLLDKKVDFQKGGYTYPGYDEDGKEKK
ncbi:MAG: carbon-nitrogen hydrolase family protein [Desulfovibrio sp.]